MSENDPELESICVLNDGTTFQDTTGTVVIEYRNANLSEDVRDSLKDGVIGDLINDSERVMKVPELVELYKAMLDLDINVRGSLPNHILNLIDNVE